MHYVIFGKFQNLSKPLNPNIKLYLWDVQALLSMFAQKYLSHKSKNNLYNQDIYFYEKVKVYKLTSEQYEQNGDVIMFDPTTIQNYKYPEMEISNINLNGLCTKFQDPNIIINIINI